MNDLVEEALWPPPPIIQEISMRRVFILATMLASCQSFVGAVRVAQTVMEPYAFFVKGSAEGLLGVNARFLAIDANVSLHAIYYGPDGDVFGAPQVVRWEKEIQRGPGKRAYEAVFGLDGKFITVRPASWDTARASMPFLPPNDSD